MDALIDGKVFRRARKSNEVRALGVRLYYLGLSVWKAEAVLLEFGGASHEAVRRWHHRCRDLFDPPPRERRAVAVDETKVRIAGKEWYLWAAVDVDRPEVLAAWITPARSSFEALQFLRAVLRRCSNKPLVLVDRGPWYRWGLDRLGVPWRHETFGERSAVERWFGVFKQRAKLFWKRWPHNAGPEDANSWCLAFAALYNLWEG